MTRETVYATGDAVLSVGGQSLYYLIRRPWQASEKKKAIIVLHGARSDGQDIFTLTHRLPGDYFIIAPKGPFMLVAGTYAWYDIDFSAGKPATNPAQETVSRQLIVEFVEQVRKKFQLDEIHLCGFSQGAVMTYTVGLTNPAAFKSIIVLSGRIPFEIAPQVSQDSALQRLQVFIIHGAADATLPVSYAREAREYLRRLTIPVTYREFEIDHEISDEVIDTVKGFFKETFAR